MRLKESYEISRTGTVVYLIFTAYICITIIIFSGSALCQDGLYNSRRGDRRRLDKDRGKKLKLFFIYYTTLLFIFIFNAIIKTQCFVM